MSFVRLTTNLLIRGEFAFSMCVRLTDYLLSSDARFSSHQESLGNHGITHILDLTKRMSDTHERLSIHLRRLPVLGIRGEPLEGVFEAAHAFVESSIAEGGTVLIQGGHRALVMESDSAHIEGRLLAVATACLMPQRSLKEAFELFRRSVYEQLSEEGKNDTGGVLSGASAFILQSLISWDSRVCKPADGPCDLEALTPVVSHSNATEDLLSGMPWRTGKGPVDSVDSTAAVVYNGHRMQLRAEHLDPRMCSIENFLTEEETDELIDAARSSGFKQSLVASTRQATADGAELSADLILEEGRTSTSSTVKRTTPVAAAAISRAAFLAGFSPFCAEALQVVHYDPGQKYDLHNDWFDPSSPYYADRMRARGQRIVSIFCYLTDVEGGGCTHFPQVGKRFKPKKGSAVLWFNQDTSGNMDERVLHAGEEVTAGDKWGANIWIRERPPDRSIAAIIPRDGVGRIQVQDGLGRIFKSTVYVPQ